jgi:sugar phosphate isomerase/epimerase
MDTPPLPPSGLPRRRFLRKLLAGSGAALIAPAALAAGAESPAAPAAARKLQLGFDNFSIRNFGWKANQLLDYAASLRVDTVLFSDLKVYESHSAQHLREVKARADDLGIAIQAGTGSICPTSTRFSKEFGSAEEHLRLAMRIARALGSRAVRCFLGGMDDRRGAGGIRPHIESTVEVLRKVRSEALDGGLKIAVENHAGDLQAWELVELIEAAGKEHVGATVDSGNATWTLEDPADNLRLLGPYTVSSGIRDSMVWEYEKGAMVQWTALGEGCVDLEAYVKLFAELCPDAPIQLEIISGFARPFAYLEKEFWPPYPEARASDFAAFVALAKRGRPLEPFRVPPGADREEATRQYQKDELERSLRYARGTLGLGRRA